ncbi:MAG: hypothetical protein ACKPE3_30535, partial [Sphaerospermopsis kisseleviana]
MNFQLRNSFVVGSLGVSLTGFIVLFTPYNQFSQFLMSSGLGSLASSSLAIQSSQKIANRKSKKFLNEIESLKADTTHFSKLLQVKHKELIEALTDRENYAQSVVDLSEIINTLKTELTTTKAQLADSQEINFTSAIATLRDSLIDVKTQVNNLIPYLVKKFDIDINSMMQEFSREVIAIDAQISVFSDNSNLRNEELISCCIALQHQILTKGIGMKAKLYKSVVEKLQKQFNDVMPIREHNQKVTQLREEYLKNIRAIHQEFHEVADIVISNYKNDFNEAVNDGLNQSQELAQLQNEIISLNNKLQDLSKPLQFVGASESARVGNSIINYYQTKLGITLDAIDFSSTEIGYKLLFHLSRNNRFIPADQLNDGNNPDKIKELSGSLSSPKFIQSERSNYVSL